MRKFTQIAGVAMLTLSAGVMAAGEQGGHHGDHSAGHGASQGPAIGEPGSASDASRTIEVSMMDNYFEPESISVRAGETVRFVVKNDGALVHEFNIATAEMHEAHQDEMQMMVEHGVIKGDRLDRDMMNMDMGGHSMKHDHANSVLLEPGETGEIIWTFSGETDLEFACNVPGHYAVGMYGDLSVE